MGPRHEAVADGEGREERADGVADDGGIEVSQSVRAEPDARAHGERERRATDEAEMVAGVHGDLRSGVWDRLRSTAFRPQERALGGDVGTFESAQFQSWLSAA